MQILLGIFAIIVIIFIAGRIGDDLGEGFIILGGLFIGLPVLFFVGLCLFEVSPWGQEIKHQQAVAAQKSYDAFWADARAYQKKARQISLGHQ